MKILILFFSLLLLTACTTYSEDDKSNFDTQIEAYLKKNNKACERSSSGLYYNIIEQGEGREIKYGDRIAFTYKGELLDGTVFDKRTKPIEFDVDILIAAWKEAMLMLNEGGKAYIVAPPHLGYGTHELSDIPANSIIVYTLEVVKVK
jgi:FKBP-type peptidyl-prolyl cis-trans isomerase FkpA